MKRILVIITSLFCLVSYGQEIQKPAPYNPGDHHFQLGVGYPNLATIAVTALNQLQDYTKAAEPGRSIPQITLSYDYALDNKLSFGLFAGVSQATTPRFSPSNVLSDDYNDYLNGIDVSDFLQRYFGGSSTIGNFDISQDIQYRLTSFSFGGRGLTHLHRSEIVDIYARGQIGFTINKIKNIASDTEGATLDRVNSVPVPKISLGGHFGLRYYFNEKWGAYGEVGYSTTDILQAGVSYRILKKEGSSSK
jgi:hypothetical protein